jgi:hypothetical protein
VKRVSIETLKAIIAALEGRRWPTDIRDAAMLAVAADPRA